MKENEGQNVTIANKLHKAQVEPVFKYSLVTLLDKFSKRSDVKTKILIAQEKNTSVDTFLLLSH